MGDELLKNTLFNTILDTYKSYVTVLAGYKMARNGDIKEAKAKYAPALEFYFYSLARSVACLWFLNTDDTDVLHDEAKTIVAAGSHEESKILLFMKRQEVVEGLYGVIDGFDLHVFDIVLEMIFNRNPMLRTACNI